MANYADILMGRLFLQNRLTPVAEVKACLAHAVAEGQPLSDVLIQRGYAQPAQIQQATKVIAHKQFLRGELIFAQILMRRGLVSRVALREAFEIQKQSRCRERLGQILMDCRLLLSDQVESVVDAQLLELAEGRARIEAQGLIPGPRKTVQRPKADVGQQRPIPPTDAKLKAVRPESGPADFAEEPELLAERTLPVDSGGVTFEPYVPKEELPIDTSVLQAANLWKEEAFELANPPTNPRSVSFSSARILRAFDSAMLASGADGMLWRQNPKRGQGKSKPIRVIYDTDRGMFKSPLEPEIVACDLFQLADGNVYQVTKAQVLAVAGTRCYQQVWVAPLGISMESLRSSWEGIVPNPHP